MRRSFPVILTTTLLVVLAVWAAWQTDTSDPDLRLVRIQPTGIMGTVSTLAVMSDGTEESAVGLLGRAEARLRYLEALLSTWIDSSQLSRFNASAAGEGVELAGEVVQVLAQARNLHARSDGAFDVTARPLIELWRRAAERQRLPTPVELEQARAASSWDLISLTPDAASKSLGSARVDVDGIAKGYAIDRALETLVAGGARGGLVEVGGDLAVFGQGPHDGRWLVAVRSPFTDVAWAELEISGGAVCSSGDYARFVEIEGRRFSHILDPRSGWPSEETVAVTVVGQEASVADAWATAISILGVSGLELLRSESALEAMVVTGEPQEYQVWATPGFAELVVLSEFSLSLVE